MAYYKIVLHLYGFIPENMIICKRRPPNAKLKGKMKLESMQNL